MAHRTVRAIAAATLGAALLALPAAAEDFQTIARECRAANMQERACKSADQLGSVIAQACRFGGGPDEACAFFKGRVISSALVDAFQGSWIDRALADQRRLGDSLPMREAIFVATHNSFNAANYSPTLSGLDHNQQYTIYDQLRTAMRGLELDLHWFPSKDAAPGEGGRAPLLCHATGPHAGCTIERHMREGLLELRAWLDEHPGEVIVVDLENALDDLTAHNRAAATIEEVLGSGSARDVIWRPTGGCGAGLPLSASRDQIRAAGKQIVFASSCGQGAAWQQIVHSHSTNWRQAQVGSFKSAPPCGFARSEYETKWIRFWEDSTWLSAMAGASSGAMDAATVAAMTRCDVNMPSFDQIAPDDPRLEALVWSWDAGEPASGGGSCAAHGASGRFRAQDCATALPFACATAAGAWSVSTPSGPHGSPSCSPGSAFAVPRTGHQNEALRAAKSAAGVSDVWIAFRLSGGVWSA